MTRIFDCLHTCYRNYLSSVLIQELFVTWDHEDLSLRAKVSLVGIEYLDFLLPPESCIIYDS